MKKRTRRIAVVVGIVVILALIFVGTQTFFLVGKTPYTDAATEMNGVTMKLIGEPTRESITYQISSDSDQTMYTGEDYSLEYYFLGEWHQLRLRENATCNLQAWYVRSSVELELTINPSLWYETLPLGKYRLVKQIDLVQSTLYEDRDKFFNLYVEFEM